MRKFVIKYLEEIERYDLLGPPGAYLSPYILPRESEVQADTFEEAVSKIEKSSKEGWSRVQAVYGFEDITLERATDPIEVMQSVL